MTSKIVQNDDGSYRDKTPDEIERDAKLEGAAEALGAEPVPFTEDGSIDGQALADSVAAGEPVPADATEGSTTDAPAAGTSKTKTQK